MGEFTETGKAFQGPSSFCLCLVSNLTYCCIPSCTPPQMMLHYMQLLEHNMALDTSELEVNSFAFVAGHLKPEFED